MAIPDFQTLFLPLLKLAGDGREHSLDEAILALAAQFRLSEDERKELLPSGRQAKFDNRTGWARTYLKKAGLLESTGRGKFRITQRGLDILGGDPVRVDVRFLKQFPEFVEFHKATKREAETEEIRQTPEEALGMAYQNLKQALAQDVLERVRACSPRFFERLVVELLVAMGYGGSRSDAGQAVGQTGDGGIDGIIKEDKLGLDVVCIQAKRWEGKVGRPVVQAFAGSLEGHRARKGVLITTSQFSQDATDYVSKIEKRIVLIDGERLAQLMIDHDIGVAEIARYQVKKVDLDYFADEY
jgi:restriction system protein